MLLRVGSIVAMVWILACSPPPKPTAPPAQAGPKSETRTGVAIFLGHVGGHGVDVVGADGALQFSYSHVENGRGPRVGGSAKLAGDGTLVSFKAVGKQTFGNAIDEQFEIADGTATWKSKLESGSATLSGPAFYVPAAPWPGATRLLFDALQKNGGELALLPAGRATLSRLGDKAVTAPNGETETLVAWEITGLDFMPTVVWTRADGSYLGKVDEYYSYLPDGWQEVIAPLVAEQKSYRRAREKKLVAALAQHHSAQGLAITNANVLDVEKGRWLPDHTVLIEGDRIVKIGSTDETKVPAGAKVIDAAGKSLVPGLWDMHAHLGDTDALLNLASGVTTARDLGNDPDYLDGIKERYDAGTAAGPHVIRSGFIEGRGPKSASSKVKASTVDEAKAAVAFYAKRGYSGIKIYNSMKAELVPVLAKAAHERGMRVSGHVPVFMRAEDVVRDGYDEIQHINMLFLNFLVKPDTDTRTLKRFTLVGDEGPDLDLDSQPVKDFIALLAKKGIVIDPTVSVFQWMFEGRPGAIVPGWEAAVPRLPVQVRRGFLGGGLSVGADKDARYRTAFRHMLDMVRRLHEAGITIVPGTDSLAGFSLHRELALYVEAGIPAADVLRIATIGSAKVMKRDAETGSIAPGKIADLVLVDGDPLADITALDKTVTVVRSGVVYDCAKLYEAIGVTP